ncbi:hypothetical protein [Streptomyces sp. NRRL F-5123]|nr:hypothetical protein [Streptomyces sp. NRRL F-5123]
MTTLVKPAPAREQQRGHGALYDGINHGGLDVGRLRRTTAHDLALAVAG